MAVPEYFTHLYVPEFSNKERALYHAHLLEMFINLHGMDNLKSSPFIYIIFSEVIFFVSILCRI